MALFVAARARARPVAGYPPATVKQTVVGHGRATKQQVGFLVRALLSLRRAPGARRRRRARDRHLPCPAPAASAAVGVAESADVIAFLRGRLLENDGETAVVDVGGGRLSGARQRRHGRRAPAVGAETRALRPHPLRQGRAPAPLRLRRRGRARAVPDPDRRSGRRAAGGARHPGRHRGRRAGARHRVGGRQPPHPGEGRGAQDRRAAGARAAREDPDRAGGGRARGARRRPARQRTPAGPAWRGLRRAGHARLQAGEIRVV